MNFNVKVNDKQLKRVTKNLIKQTQNTNPLLKQIGQDEINKAKARIRTTKTSPDGQKWAPWSYKTLKSGSRRRGSLLYRTGQLFNSFVMTISKFKLNIANKAKYSGYLQFGTRRMPARPFLGWSRKSISEVKSNFDKWISRGLK